VVDAKPAVPPTAPPMMAPGTQPMPSSGAVAAAPMPQPTAAPPRPPSVRLAPGFGVHLARARSPAPAAIEIVILIGFPFSIVAARFITAEQAFCPVQVIRFFGVNVAYGRYRGAGRKKPVPRYRVEVIRPWYLYLRMPIALAIGAIAPSVIPRIGMMVMPPPCGMVRPAMPSKTVPPARRIRRADKSGGTDCQGGERR